jgi:hypothetical protein
MRIKMTKENDAELLAKYDNGSNSKYYLTNIMSSLGASSITNVLDNVDVLDIDLIAQQMAEFMEYCRVLKRFRKLRSMFDDKLTFFNPVMISSPISKHPCFIIDTDDHIVFDLDDVEKFWNNRALL